MITPTCFVGCDVGKKEVALFHSNAGISLTIPNQPEALARFVDTLGSGCLVVCEATGGYEAALLEAVHRAGHACHRADARKSLPPRRRG